MNLERSKKLAIEWFKHNFKKKGLWHYVYDIKNDTHSTNNNELRQLMSSRLAAELSHTYSDFVHIHLNNMDFILKNWYKEMNEIGYIHFSNKSKLGANAMFLRTLVYSPFFNKYKQIASKVANGIICLLNENGSFKPWLIKPDYKYDHDYLLTFYSGEAVLALLEYYDLVKDPTILKNMW